MADQSTATPRAVVHRTDELTARETASVNARQTDLMANESADGRPPTHRQRMAGWRWVAIGAPALLLGAVVWAMSRGQSAGLIIGLGVVFLLVLLLAGWPVIAAGLRRDKEETVARKEAVVEVLVEEAKR